jgi:hypothetical protein
MISITARNGTHRFQYCAASSRYSSIALLGVGLTGQTASKYGPNCKWIGQKKTIRQWQVFRKFYDDAIEVLLKFCGGAIEVL